MQNNNHFWWGENAFAELQNFLDRQQFSRLFFLVDENTHNKCLPYLLQSFESLPEYEVLEVDPGEGSKSPEVLFQLWMALSELNADRHSLIINVGGGMITDLGGFLAGTYLRGIAFVNVPTSLLAMVDASSGGKNGINLNHLKNRVGLFLDPDAVCVVPDFLETLPMREIRSGFAEMLKHGLIADKEYWKQLSAIDINNELPDVEMIVRSIEIKQSIVEDDFRESGLRKVLNFGHTIGHALETYSMEQGKDLLHGEAIAMGMITELYLSEKYTGLNPQTAKEISLRLKEIFADLRWDFEDDHLLDIMRRDKKNRKSQMCFSLLENIGKPVVDVVVEDRDVKEALAYLKEIAG